MRILAVDTSAMVASVAIMEDAELVAEFNINHTKNHSTKLMPLIRQVLSEIDQRPADIDVFAVAIGPGSFTGLRIGITTIKAMAYAENKPTIGINTLDALAYNIPYQDGLICPMLDARNTQVYTSLYRFINEKQVRLTEYMGVPVKELCQIIRDRNQSTLFVGDGAICHKDFLMTELPQIAHFAPANLILQRASSVASLASPLAHDNQFTNSFDLAPYYLRKSQAERLREQQQ